MGTTADAIDNDLKTRCLEAGFDDVICKPVNKESLKKILKISSLLIGKN